MFTENETLLDNANIMFFTVCLIVFDKISDYCRRQPRVIKRTLLNRNINIFEFNIPSNFVFLHNTNPVDIMI